MCEFSMTVGYAPAKKADFGISRQGGDIGEKDPCGRERAVHSAGCSCQAVLIVGIVEEIKDNEGLVV